MNKIYIILFVSFVWTVLGCQSASSNKPAVGADQQQTPGNFLPDQAYLTHVIKINDIADKERTLVHLSHVCNLSIAGQPYAVIDMRELVKGAVTPRGINQIILLNIEYQLINRVEYGQARPLFCDGNKLYLYNELFIDGQEQAGNILQFNDEGFAITVLREDIQSRLP